MMKTILSDEGIPHQYVQEEDRLVKNQRMTQCHTEVGDEIVDVILQPQGMYPLLCQGRVHGKKVLLVLRNLLLDEQNRLRKRLFGTAGATMMKHHLVEGAKDMMTKLCPTEVEEDMMTKQCPTEGAVDMMMTGCPLKVEEGMTLMKYCLTMVVTEEVMLMILHLLEAKGLMMKSFQIEGDMIKMMLHQTEEEDELKIAEEDVVLPQILQECPLPCRENFQEMPVVKILVMKCRMKQRTD